MNVTDRIAGPAIDAYQNLSGPQQNEIDEFLEENRSQRLHSVEELVDAWLRWHGISGYTHSITELVLAAHKG